MINLINSTASYINSWRGLVLALMISLCMQSYADDLYVIVNPGVELGASDVRDVYLGEKLLAGNVKLAPVDNTAAQAKFLAKVMSLEQAKYESIWIKKGFRDGLQAPNSKSSDADVIAYVKRVPGAMGYVSALNGDATSLGVKLVKKF